MPAAGTIREDLEKAFAKHDEDGGEEPEAVEAAPGDGTGEAPEVEEPEPELEAGAEEAEEPAAGDEPEEREGRDEKGRFKPRGQEQKPTQAQGQPKPAAAQAPAAAAEAAAAAAAAAQPALKPPPSWKAAAREKWAGLPPEVQAEAIRIDGEVKKVMQQAAPLRQFTETFQRTLAPFEHMIRSEQAARGEQYNPLRTVQSLLQTAAQLRTLPSPGKAELIADICHQYGIGVEDLDTALVKRMGGKPADGKPAPAQHQQQTFRDPRVDELLARETQGRQLREQQVQDQASAEVQAFEGKAEFLEDVRADMSRLIMAAAEAGEDLSLQDAYDTALLLPKHKSIQEILKQRAAAAAVPKRKAATVRARQAASSVRGQPVIAPSREGTSNSRRDDIAAAFEEAETR